MSTRSNIGILNSDGTVDAVFCHWDGYPNGVGVTLRDYYTTEEKVRKLISMGAIDSLGEEIDPDPSQPHGFYPGPTQEGVCAFYCRDGEEQHDLEILHFNSIDEFLDLSYGGRFYAEYLYYYYGNIWYCYDVDEKAYLNLYSCVWL